MDYFRDAVDPGRRLVKELFPDVERPSPAGRGDERNGLVIGEVMDRVGRPVAYFDPELDEFGPEPYVLYQLIAPGVATWVHVDLFGLAAPGDVGNPYDYAPDGTPLDDHEEG